jgi:hypothetical protein
MSQNTPMPRDEIHDYIATLPGVIALKTWGELSYFYNPGRSLPRGTYFACVFHAHVAIDSMNMWPPVPR